MENWKQVNKNTTARPPNAGQQRADKAATSADFLATIGEFKGNLRYLEEAVRQNDAQSVRDILIELQAFLIYISVPVFGGVKETFEEMGLTIPMRAWGDALIQSITGTNPDGAGYPRRRDPGPPPQWLVDMKKRDTKAANAGDKDGS